MRGVFKVVKEKLKKAALAAATVAPAVLIGDTNSMYSSTNNFIISIMQVALPVLIALAFVRMLFRNIRD